MDPTNATALIHDSMPLCRTLGITARVATKAEVVLELDWSADLCTIGGVMHGGALMALADSAGAMVAFFNLPEGSIGTSTIESKTNLFRSVGAGTVIAAATVLHRGSSTIVVETELMNPDRLVAKVTQTQMVLRPRSS